VRAVLLQLLRDADAIFEAFRSALIVSTSKPVFKQLLATKSESSVDVGGNVVPDRQLGVVATELEEGLLVGVGSSLERILQVYPPDWLQSTRVMCTSSALHCFTVHPYVGRMTALRPGSNSGVRVQGSRHLLYPVLVPAARELAIGCSSPRTPPTAPSTPRPTTTAQPVTVATSNLVIELEQEHPAAESCDPAPGPSRVPVVLSRDTVPHTSPLVHTVSHVVHPQVDVSGGEAGARFEGSLSPDPSSNDVAPGGRAARAPMQGLAVATSVKPPARRPPIEELLSSLADATENGPTSAVGSASEHVGSSCTVRLMSLPPPEPAEAPRDPSATVGDNDIAEVAALLGDWDADAVPVPVPMESVSALGGNTGSAATQVDTSTHDEVSGHVDGAPSSAAPGTVHESAKELDDLSISDVPSTLSKLRAKAADSGADLSSMDGSTAASTPSSMTGLAKKRGFVSKVKNKGRKG
jgi:hypothetical protein